MRARAERRLGIEPENDVFRLRFIRLPGRLDHDALPHALRMEIRLPIILPVRVGDMAHKRRARRRVEAIGAREPRDPIAKLRKARREILVLRQIRLHDDRLLRLRRRGLPALRLREILPLLLRILVDDAPRAHIEQRLRDKLHLLMRRLQTDFRPIQKNPSFPHGSKPSCILLELSHIGLFSYHIIEPRAVQNSPGHRAPFLFIVSIPINFIQSVFFFKSLCDRFD